MHFDLSDLRLFVCIAEVGTLTKGARQAFLSAPAASARLKALEKQLGQNVFYRDNRGVTLTLAGEKLLRHARIILRQVEHAKSDLSHVNDDAFGHVRIFANTSAVTEFMPKVLGRFMAERPHVTVDLFERPVRDVVRGVTEGTVDIGIVAGCSTPPHLQGIHFSTDRMVLVTPPQHDLGERKTVYFAESLPYQHVGLHEGSSLHAFMQEVVSQQNLPLMMRIQLRSFEAMCSMISAGVGVGVLPESAAQRYSRTMPLQVCQLSDAWAVRERQMLVRDHDALPACAQALIGAVLAYFPGS